MKINELEIDIQRSKERSPETFNEIVNVTIPFYMFYQKISSGVNRLEEEKYQMNNSELDVLSSLKMSGNEEYILSPTKLQERLLFTGGAITKVLKKLEEKGYIVRLDTKHDKRIKLVQLTPLGREIHDKVLKDVLEYEAKCFASLNEEEKNTMKSLFVKMLKKL
jgi:DNA-binding MarR family transcriptional regulator